MSGITREKEVLRHVNKRESTPVILILDDCNLRQNSVKVGMGPVSFNELRMSHSKRPLWYKSAVKDNTKVTPCLLMVTQLSYEKF